MLYTPPYFPQYVPQASQLEYDQAMQQQQYEQMLRNNNEQLKQLQMMNNYNLMAAMNKQQQAQQIPVQAMQPVQSLFGRVVNDPKEILAKEVDMDGRICYFPTVDQSAIYAKTWDNNGNLTTTVYQRMETPAHQEQPDVQMMALGNILDRLTTIEKILMPGPAQKKKGDATNESADA